MCVCVADIVSDEHFGGGMLSMRAAGDEETREKTWRERMEEIIAKSKKAKVPPACVIVCMPHAKD